MFSISSTNDSGKRLTETFYFCVYLFLSAVFLAILYRPILKSAFEQDLWWFIPTVSQITEGLSFAKTFGFLFAIKPLWTGVASLKIIAFSILSLFGPQAKYFIFFSILIHFACSYLLFSIARKVGMNYRVSLFSALMYLTLFAHFHAYIWPMAFQHLAVTFFTLLVLNFYLKTDQLITSRSPSFRSYWVLTLALNLMASFCRLSILLLPLIILAHILFCSEGGKDKSRKYNIWIPLFITYLFYPLITLTYVGDIKLSMFFSKINIPARYPFLFIFAAAFLFLFSLILFFLQNYRPKRISRWILVIISSGIFLALLGLKDIGLLTSMKNLLLFYNLLVPFAGLLASFLHPIQNALLIDSSSVDHFIPPQVDVFNMLLTLLLIAVFVKVFVCRNKGLIVFLAWYLVSFLYLNLRNPIASRHFIYISPAFCIIFCSVLSYIYSCLMKKARLKIIYKEIILVLIFIGIFIPNILAIRFEIFRGKLVNTFLIYDYVRVANIIKEDLAKNSNIRNLTADKIYINGVTPMSYELWSVIWEDALSPIDPLRYDNFRYLLAQVFNNNSMVNVHINQAPHKGHTFYLVDDKRITNAQGEDIEPFLQLFQKAVKEMELEHYKVAGNLFQKAIDRRPFLLNYVLSKYSLGDLKWITSGDPMRSWVNRIALGYCRDVKPPQEVAHIMTLIDKELDDYIQCLFYFSYLKYLSGDTKESKYWVSQIGFFERDYERLSSWLGQTPIVKSNYKILSFLEGLNDYSLVEQGDCLTYYELERFIFNLISGIQIIRDREGGWVLVRS